MSLKKFLFSRTFIKHLIFAIVLIILLLFITLQGLKLYTKHGQSNPVPDFYGLSLGEVAQLGKQHKLRIEIVDSVHFDNAIPGVIVDQVPEAGTGVKENRIIFLTINSTIPEQVQLPKLTDISYRQAQVLIETCGLQIGNISYKPSDYNDLILQVQIDSTDIFPGEKIPKGATIDLIVGRTQGNLSTTLPDLTGTSIEEATEILVGAMLNLGVIIYDESVSSEEDSLTARVWKQNPDIKFTTDVNMGSSVDLWVTVDSLKLEDTPEIFF